jgi:DNA adenine methylase
MMSAPPLVPPLKCQGIKTKLVGEIARLASHVSYDRWVEPFCGSCAVPLNIQPRRALLCDSNVHIIQLYCDIQSGKLTPSPVRQFLEEHGEKLRRDGVEYYYRMREQFNNAPDSFAFLFLNRCCFNGVMRFNRRGKFNVPYGHKDERFSKAYVTKITNQVRRIREVLAQCDWTFEVKDFRAVLATLQDGDFLYADPPYAGRHVDYYNSWSEQDENDLAASLASVSCPFIFSTWHSNEFRVNDSIARNWSDGRFHLFTRKHFYHVGSHEELRHPMMEALITNFSATRYEPSEAEQLSFLEEPLPESHVAPPGLVLG